MSVFPSWPWTNFHEENLDWVIKTVKKCKETVAEALADVSNAVAAYFADHIDTTLTQSDEAADAAAVGNRLTALSGNISNVQTTLSNNILSVQASIPELDVTLSSPQAAAPAATVGSRLTNIQNDITNLQNATSHHTYKITLTESANASVTCSLTPLEGMDVNDTAYQMRTDLENGYGMFINVHENRYNPGGKPTWSLAYNIRIRYGDNYLICETDSYVYTVITAGSMNPVTAVAK